MEIQGNNNRLTSLFASGKKNVLNIYCTAGFPHLEDTIKIMKALEDNGADIIELGMPYSDPLADGPVIQQSGATAIENGMSIEKLFQQLQNLRPDLKVPVVLMGYYNPILQYGLEKFCRKASELGVDGLIIPDLPPDEFEARYQKLFNELNLSLIFLVTPDTPESRVRKLDELSSGFLYAVTSASITGSAKNIDTAIPYFQRLKSFDLKNPILAGFGIHDRETFEKACSVLDGAIIGSAYIRALPEGDDVQKQTKDFLQNILKPRKELI